MSIRLPLDLAKHCIETEIKAQHNQALFAYFLEDADREHLEQIIELTKSALKHLDFPRLRSEYPQLAGGAEVDVALAKGEASYTIVIGNSCLIPLCLYTRQAKHDQV